MAMAPRPGAPRNPNAPPAAPAPTGPAVKVEWSKESGPGEVQVSPMPGRSSPPRLHTARRICFETDRRERPDESASTLNVSVETPPPAKQLEAVYTKNFKVHSKFWDPRVKALMVNWIPHCIDIINRNDVTLGPGGIDNFIEAGKKLRGEPAGLHKGYVFSNAWVHQTVEAMSIALMVDPQGDAEISTRTRSSAPRSTTGFRRSSPRRSRTAICRRRSPWTAHGRNGGRSTAASSGTGIPLIAAITKAMSPGYFLESAINHYLMTDKKDARLYNAAKKLADCWYAQSRPRAEEGVVRRPSGDGAGAGALRPLRQRHGRRRQGRRVHRRLAKFLLDSPVHRGGQSGARSPGIRPEPPARDAAVRSRRARGPRGVHLFRDGGRRGGDARPRLPERGEFALGQHRQQEVLRHRRHRQRRDVRGLRAELLAAATTPTASRAPAAA